MTRHWMMASFLGLILSLILPRLAAAEDWLLVETRKVPDTCAHPLICLPKSELESRHLLKLTKKNQNSFFGFLKSVASISGIPNIAVAGLHPPDPQTLHQLDIAPKLRPLRDHPGVYFESSKLDGGDVTAEFSDMIRQRLSALGLRFLTKEEWENTPGKPTLSVRFSARLESAGCIVPFSLSMTLKEEVVLVRDPSQKISATVWNYSRRQNLANTNYGPTNSLFEIVEKFEADWRAANRAG
ncbi:hypothetical protein [Cognatishimia sp.]|uniref:hypothetical protein n=1 Tax=Cognatishimia sp. TaxID=2211648 RepID=UPI003514157E